MTWPAYFNARLAGDFVPVWSLRTLFMPLEPNLPAISLESGSSLNMPPPPIAIQGLSSEISLPGEAVDPGTWNATHGSWAVEFVDEPSTLAAVAAIFGRGRPVILYLGTTDLPWNNFQPVALGAVEQVEMTSARSLRISVGGLGQLLGSRLDRSIGAGNLFYNLPAETTITTANYTAGASVSLSVASVTGAERETGGFYLLKITPNSGDDFYIVGSSLTSLTFTVSPVGVLGTTDADANIGNRVQFWAYVPSDHPIDIALKVLTSTGTGTNGAYDTLPASWGLGLSAQMIDFADITRTRATVVPASGSWLASLEHGEAEADPGAWLASWLATMGIWITVRQGLITFRAAEYPVNPRQLFAIDMGQYIAIEEDALSGHVLYHPSYAGEYTTARWIDAAVTAVAAVSEVAETNPALGTYTVEGVPTYSNESASLTELSLRAGFWLVRVPEQMVIEFAGWFAAQLSCGEFVYLTTDRTVGRLTGTSQRDGVYDARVVLVEEVSPMLVDGDMSVRVTLAILPLIAQ